MPEGLSNCLLLRARRTLLPVQHFRQSPNRCMDLALPKTNSYLLKNSPPLPLVHLYQPRVLPVPAKVLTPHSPQDAADIPPLKDREARVPRQGGLDQSPLLLLVQHDHNQTRLLQAMTTLGASEPPTVRHLILRLNQRHQLRHNDIGTLLCPLGIPDSLTTLPSTPQEPTSKTTSFFSGNRLPFFRNGPLRHFR